MKNHSFCSTFLESQVIFYLFSLGIAFIPTTSALAATLSLNDYLKQVVQTSPGVAASQELIQGTVESSLEKDLPSMPSLFFQGTHTVDERQFSSSFLGGRTKSDNYSLGVQEQFDFGLNARLSYGLFSNNTSNLPAFIYPPNGTSIYTSAQTELDLTQSLWRNFLGKETRATEQVAEATSLASHYAEKFKLKQTLAAAETAYHTLAIASELVKLQRGLLDGSKRILDWNTRRVRNHLTDRIDELQSQADFQSRQLQLDTSLA